MSEFEEEHIIEAKIKPPNLSRGLRSVFVAMVLLIIFVLIFGQIVPRLLFDKGKENTLKGTESVRLESESIEKNIETNTELNPEVNIEKPIEKIEEIADKPVVIADKEPIVVSEQNLQNDELLHSLWSKIALLEADKNKIQQQTDNMVLSLVVFAQLKEEINSGRPYELQLRQLEKLAENNSDVRYILNKLSPASEQGISTRTSLINGFNLLVKQVLLNNDSRWFENMLRKFVFIRRIGEQVGEDDESVLARAEVKLDKDNLRAAVNELEQLSPSAKEIFDEWIGQANDLLDSRLKLDKLQLLLTKRESFKTDSAKTDSAFQP